ncbi:MAG: hypothetical protein ACO4BW_04380, partial [Nitriliruptoraceae bacterium]
MRSVVSEGSRGGRSDPGVARRLQVVGTVEVATRRLVTALRGGLVVSCQALPDEPLHGAAIMAAMARAVVAGGACAVRANGPAA